MPQVFQTPPDITQQSTLDITAEEYAAIIAEDQTAFTEEVFAQVSPADTYNPNWHTDCIIEYLKAVEAGQIKRLIVNVPPRTMKSITISIAWSAWLMGRDPKRRIIGASHGDSLSKRLSLDTRLVMESDIFKKAFPTSLLSGDQNEKAMFMTTQRGFRKATSVGGSIVGDGGDFLIADDLLKPDEAPSATVRNYTNDWFDQSFMTRLNDPANGRVVVVMQRLHQNDLTGHLLEKGGWEHLCLPAEFKRACYIKINDKEFNIAENTLLDPKRLSKEVLQEKLVTLGAYAYSGQYQQAPTPEGGGDFKKQWLKFYEKDSSKFTSKGMNVFILYDPANSKKKKAGHDPDYTAMLVIGLASDNNYYWLDGIRDRLNPTERVNALIKLHQKWNRLSGKPPKVGCEQYGMMTDSFYVKKAQDDLNYRFPIVELGGRLAKTDRVRQLINPFQDERVYLPRTLPYVTVTGHRGDLVKDFIEEYDTFPVGRHDDMMDAFARIMEDDLHAQFPKTSGSRNWVQNGHTFVAEGGTTSEDFFGSPERNFNPNDFRTW